MVSIAVERTRRLKQRNQVPRKLSQSTQPSITPHQSPFLRKQPFCSFFLITFAPTFCPPNFLHPSRPTLKDTSLMISLMLPQAELKVSFSERLQLNTCASVVVLLCLLVRTTSACLSPQKTAIAHCPVWGDDSCQVYCYIELYSNLDFHILQVTGES